MYFLLRCEIKKNVLIDDDHFETVVNHDHKVKVILQGKNVDRYLAN